MSPNETVRVWLVERGYNDRDLIVLKYAPTEGDRIFRRELAAQAIDIDTVTAAKDVASDDLEPVTEPDTRTRFADEATRMADEHDPDDTI